MKHEIKTILCPTDFSETSAYGLEYAAHLAKVFSARLKLLYVRTSIWPEAIQLEHEAEEGATDITNRLTEFCRETENEFGIACTHQMQITTNTLEEAIAEQAINCDLIVMGTNGADDSYEYLFGSHTFHVIEKSKCPVIVIPKGFLFKPIHTLVYAYDPETNPIFLIDQLRALVNPLHAAVKFVYISEELPSANTNHKLEILREAVMAREPREDHWSFDFNYSNDVAWAFNSYMKNHRADILALSFHHRQFLEQLTTQNVVKQLAMTADYPVFIFWR